MFRFSLLNRINGFRAFSKVFRIVFVTLFCLTAKAQQAPNVKQLIQMVNTIEQDTFKLNYNRYDRYQRAYRKQQIIDSLENINLVDPPIKNRKIEKVKEHKEFLVEEEESLNNLQTSKTISDALFRLELNNFSETKLTPQTLQVLQSYSNLKALSILLEFVTRHRYGGDAHYSLVREKLILSISKQMKIIADNTLPWYNYETQDKQILKGVQLEHGNDLLRIPLLQKNSDMDYTGALKLSLITDLFKMRIGKVNKSYQVFSYGGEVYTPYFKDANIFSKNDTFNILDRPHASYQYVGFENHGINDKGTVRWVTDIKVGVMGGRFGYNFQNILHRDISLSPAPVGWDAQIAYPGRLALQASYKHERMLPKAASYSGSDIKFVPSISGELAVGFFMTYAQVGLNVSSHNFNYKNSHNTLSKTRYSNQIDRMKRIRFFYDYDISLRAVIHNSTLEGFGHFVTNEDSEKSFADKSKYKLDKKNVRRAVLYNNLTLGLQFPSFNFFYRYSMKSPEFRSSNSFLDIDGDVINPSTRWHKWGTIGVTFIF
ncbi:MAG: hypothetical protein ACI8ZM_002500 [Crocinitomix sp.]|jgi:hypothetical protein